MTVYIQEDRRGSIVWRGTTIVYLSTVYTANYRPLCIPCPDESARRVIIRLIKITTISIPAGYQRSRYSVTSQSVLCALFSHAWVTCVNYLTKRKKIFGMRETCISQTRLILGNNFALLDMLFFLYDIFELLYDAVMSQVLRVLFFLFRAFYDILFYFLQKLWNIQEWLLERCL